MAETLNTRVTRIENLVGILADNQRRLDDVMTTLAESQIKLHEAQMRTDAQMAETDRRFAETDRRFAETEKWFRELKQEQIEIDRKTDARIEALVQAIAELIRNGRN